MQQDKRVALLGSSIREPSRRCMSEAHMMNPSHARTEYCRMSRTSTDERHSRHRYRRSLQACVEPSACGVKETSDEVSILIQRSND